MELKSARQIGGRQAVRTLLFVVFIAELYLLISETSGDFANGILFFMQEQLNIVVLVIFSILFGTTYLLGMSAGKEIITGGKNYVGVAVKYLLFELVIVLGLFILFVAARGTHPPEWSLIIPVIIEITIAMAVVWLWSAWRIKTKAQ